jgi:hypothetical protein
MSESTSDPKLAALEKSLAALIPVPGRIDRDQLLFRAGQASVRSRPWLWPAATALSIVVAGSFGTVLALRPAPATVERVVYAPAPQSDPDMSAAIPQRQASGVSHDPGHRGVETPRAPQVDAGIWWTSSAEYIRERNQAIRWGVEALPPAPSIASASQTSSVESMLGLPERKVETKGLFSLKF